MFHRFYRFLMLRGLLLLPFLLQAQGRDSCKLVLSGRLLDQKHLVPISYAEVYVYELGTGASTNNEGVFRIENLCASNYTLRISHISYRNLHIKLQISSSSRYDLVYGRRCKHAGRNMGRRA